MKELMYIFWPFILFILLFSVYAYLYFKFNSNLTKIKKFSLKSNGFSEKNIKVKDVVAFPSVANGYSYDDGLVEVVTFNIDLNRIAKVFFLHQVIASGWSFYSSAILISIKNMPDINVTISDASLSSGLLFVRKLKQRNSRIITLDKDLGFTKSVSGLENYEMFIKSCFLNHKRVIVDVFNGQILVLFPGRFFSNILSAESVNALLDNLKRCPK